MSARRRPRRSLPQPPGTDPVQLDRQFRTSVVAMSAVDDLPVEVRLAVKSCPFLVDIQRVPRGMDWAEVVRRIKAVTSQDGAAQLDRWLLHAGLRYKR